MSVPSVRVRVSGATYGLKLSIVSIRKVNLTHTQTEPTYGHKPHDFITNVK